MFLLDIFTSFGGNIESIRSKTDVAIPEYIRNNVVNMDGPHDM
jgi:hypothetical protein